MKFAVSVISPPNYAHSGVFRELADTIHYALLELGHNSIVTTQTNISDRRHIILGANLLPHYPVDLKPDSIIYNLEQITPDSPWLNPAMLDIFKRYPLWDYSVQNIAQLAAMGISGVEHMPVGYVPQLTRISRRDEDIDVLFVGSINQRRADVVEALRRRGIRAEAVFGVYGAQRDALIARSKIVLNMHYYDAKVFEIVRVSYLLANGRFVVSERGASHDEEAPFNDGVAFTAYDQLVDTCIDFLARPSQRAEIAAAGLEIMRGRPQAALLAPLLQRASTVVPQLNPRKESGAIHVPQAMNARDRAGDCTVSTTQQVTNRARTIAFFLPQFHPIPENDAAWGAGFTEWTNVIRARPAFPDHHQPHLPADLGFYDLRLPEVRDAQAELARRFGVDGFCYYHYWFHGRRLLNRPLDDMLATGQPDFPFMLCWANEDWRARWDGRSGELLQAQEYSRDDDEAHIAFLLDVFRDPRYIRVDGKPVFLVYRAASLPDPAATAALWRARAREAGIGELLLCRVESGFAGEHGDPRTIGFDAAVEFQPDWQRLGTPDPRYLPRLVFDYAQVAETAMALPHSPYPRFRCVIPRWDNTPRRPDDAIILSGATPALYRRWLAQAVRSAEPGGLVFVNAWNEWGEGAHLEPDTTYGMGFLDAHAAAVHPPVITDADTAREAILAHRHTLRELETVAERRMAVGDVEQALRVARAAADWAWYNHAGLFVSHRLERVTQAAGRRLLATLPDWTPAQAERRRVLHVLTEAHAVGGHTRLAWRWMEQDGESEHSVALTGQGSIPIPAALASAAGGRLYQLTASTVTDRVIELARLLQCFDLVVLHIHPFDAVTVAACADASKRPPTMLVNHADHVFWLGVSAADTIMDGRPCGHALTMARRGVAAGRCALLPLPLDGIDRAMDREEAKRRLGLPHDAVALVTIAAPYKFAPAGSAVFTEMALQLLAKHPRAHLIAVGPTLDTPGWAALAAAAPDRVQALGYRTDIQALLEAADIYLDSIPFTSPTSLLEAALLETPVLSFAPEPATHLLTGLDFVGPSLTAATAEEWLSLGARLIGDSTAREVYGKRLASAVRSAHLSPGWNRQLAATYAQVRHAMAEQPASVTEVLTPLDDLLYLLHERGGMARSLPALLAAHGFPVSASQQASETIAARAALSVVVLARDGVEQTVACLNELIDACASIGRLDLTVIDHATTDGTRDMLAPLAETARIVRVDDPATPDRALWALGAADAAADRVLFLSHHVLLDAPSVRRLLDEIDDSPFPVGYVGVVDEAGPLCLLYRRAHLTGKVWPAPRFIAIEEAA